MKQDVYETRSTFYLSYTIMFFKIFVICVKQSLCKKNSGYRIYISIIPYKRKYGYRENGRKLYVWDSQGFYTTHNFIGMWKFLILEKLLKEEKFSFSWNNTFHTMIKHLKSKNIRLIIMLIWFKTWSRGLDFRFELCLGHSLWD